MTSRFPSAETQGASGSAGSNGQVPERPRVLVVDDNALNVELLAVTLDRLGYEVVTADSGRSALDAVETLSPDVVLMDVLMPGMSGLEALRQLRSRAEASDLPVILVSGLGETEDIVDGLRLGANDYVTKPINLPVLQARLATQTALKRARDDLRRSAQLLEAELERKARDLDMAAHVQRSILPQASPTLHRLKTAWYYEPTSEVGGDLYDVVPLSGGRTFLFVADAMGHGVQAALVVSIVKATLTAYLGAGDDLAGLLTRLDETIAGLLDGRFVTAAACVIDPESRQLRYALAGHPPFLVSGSTGVKTIGEGSPPLGIGLGRPYRSDEMTLDPEAGVLLYSDGLTEAHDPEGAQFGLEALTARYADLNGTDPAETIRSLRATLKTFRGDEPPSDDLTILAARLV
ncbi:MAG: fused response regulator/phosphatase [Isosphaeraceae bacterium]